MTSQTCYGEYMGKVFPLPSYSVPCPSGNSCCITGDICLSNGICHFTHPPTAGGLFSGYYMGACTDPTFTDPACPKECTNVSPDVVYDNVTGEWACCGIAFAGVTCNKPTNVTFSAPAPEKLVTITATATSSSTASSSSPVSTTTTSQTNSPGQTSGPPSKSGLSAGAAAGIGIGVAISLILLAVIAAWLWYRQRKRRSPQMDCSCRHGDLLIPEMRSSAMLQEKEGSNSWIRHELPTGYSHTWNPQYGGSQMGA